MPNYAYFAQTNGSRVMIYPSSSDSSGLLLQTCNVRVKMGDCYSIGNMMTLNASYSSSTFSTIPIYNGLRYSEGELYNASSHEVEVYCRMNASQNYYTGDVSSHTRALSIFNLDINQSENSICTLNKTSIMDKYILIRDVYLFGSEYPGSNSSFQVFEDL